jgi:hypothetical protein
VPRRRRAFDAVLEEPDRAAREHLGVDRAGHGDNPLDVVGELRFRPDDAIDAELLEPLLPIRHLNEVVTRHEADRARRAEAVRDPAGDDVHLVQARAGHEDVGLLDARAAEDLGGRPAPLDELDVELLESVRGLGIAVDHDDFVPGRQRLGEAEADLSAADDDDPHRRRLLDRRVRDGGLPDYRVMGDRAIEPSHRVIGGSDYRGI